jgi:hypothetical protein
MVCLNDRKRSAIVPDGILASHNTIQHAKSARWNCEEVHCRDGFTMIVQKCLPSSRWIRIARCFAHPSQDRPLGNIEPEHLQFPMNSRRAPGAIFSHHAEDQFSQFTARRLPSHYSMFAREPFPVQPESSAMPANDGFWLHYNECASPSRPESLQQNPENSIRSGKGRATTLLLQCGELLPEGEIFKEKIAARANKPKQQPQEKDQQT